MKRFKIRVDGKEYFVEVENIDGVQGEGGKKAVTMERREGGAGVAGSTAPKEKAVFAPMPAKVIRVNCKKGDRVKKGDALIVIEAMKMENEIISNKDGVIKDVMVSEGDSVSNNDILVVFA